ncbi:multidrug resistance efflux pump [Chitinophaga niastensis]|uniref:Multidrug resistance efflux pump n=1 Tax=Chitinophaga niastensis TaxID=536980 RepID=A0A2P8HDP1_CHINA|nr:HlyD family efflux transporter periplasmic adaptor subunit [Chitinophaga niastensis]PSL44338.1 multidrug resistance efflux pump [Chitinophaga niastensis]
MKKTFGILPGIILLCFACKPAAEHHPYRKDIIDAVYASGYLIPENEYRVYAQTNGVIVAKMVQEGDTVNAGQLLYRIQSAVAAARQAATTAAYNNATLNAGPQSAVLKELEQAVKTATMQRYNDSVNFVRYENLLNQKAIAKIDYDHVRLQYLSSQNDYEAKQQRLIQQQQQTRLLVKDAQSKQADAVEQLQQTAVRSSIQGRVFELLKQPGEVVMQNEWIATMGKAGALYAQLWLDENDFSRVRTGQLLWMKIDAFPGKTYKAQVSRIYLVIQRDKQSFRVDARILDTMPEQVAYGALEANIVIQKRERGMVIPKAWLSGPDSVFVKTNGKKTKIAVVKGIETMDEVEIRSGLNDNSVILPGS